MLKQYLIAAAFGTCGYFLGTAMAKANPLDDYQTKLCETSAFIIAQSNDLYKIDRTLGDAFLDLFFAGVEMPEVVETLKTMTWMAVRVDISVGEQVDRFYEGCVEPR